MAEYKDIDEILKKLPDDLPYKASVKRVLIQAPAADVVPRSEVEKLQAEAENLRNANADLALALLYECEPTKEHLSELEKAVREKVAREIFEEIEEDVLDFPMKDSDIQIILDKGRYDKLKKKYTERVCTDCKHFVGCEKANWVRYCEEYTEGKE